MRYLRFPVLVGLLAVDLMWCNDNSVHTFVGASPVRSMLVGTARLGAHGPSVEYRHAVEMQTLFGCQGWRYVGDNLDAVELEKDGLRLLVDCISSTRATLTAVQLATEDRMTNGRHFVVVVPDSAEPGLVDEMLSREVSVVPYRQLSQLDSILAEHRIAMDKFAAAEQRMLTNRLDAPTPAQLLSPSFAGVVAETDRVQCFFRDVGTDTLVIAFNDSWRSGPDDGLHPNIDMAGLGFSIVDFVTKEPNWFPADDMAALVPAVLEILAGRFPEACYIRVQPRRLWRHQI